MRKRIIRTKIKEMEESLDLIRDNLPAEFEDFSKMGLSKDGIYKNIEFCIQQVIDICSIINSDLEFGVPSEEKEIVENLMENNILSQDIGEKIKKMKGFRNILVHRYGKINDKQAFTNIHKGIEDFQIFLEEIEETLSEY